MRWKLFQVKIQSFSNSVTFDPRRTKMSATCFFCQLFKHSKIVSNFSFVDGSWASRNVLRLSFWSPLAILFTMGKLSLQNNQVKRPGCHHFSIMFWHSGDFVFAQKFRSVSWMVAKMYHDKIIKAFQSSAAIQTSWRSSWTATCGIFLHFQFWCYSSLAICQGWWLKVPIQVH